MNPISIRIAAAPGTSLRSLTKIEWTDIPPFALLTGRNGCGKSQLLEFLAYKLSAVNHPHHGPLTAATLEIVGDKFPEGTVAYMPNAWAPSGSAFAAAQADQFRNGLYQQIMQSIQNPHDLMMRRRRSRLESILGKPFQEVTPEEFLKILPKDLAFLMDDLDAVSGFAQVFLAYRFQAAEALEKKKSEAEILTELGRPPWEVLNEILTAANFAYQVASPMDGGLWDAYYVRFVADGVQVQPHELSSGEKVILGMISWLFNSQRYGQFPKLFLLDEPDAHLHPALTNQFLEIVQSVLVEKLGVRVIMATHSPSTVALAPQDSIFEMRRGETEIRKAEKDDAINSLTAGLVHVGDGTRFVLVEAQADVGFFSAVYGLLTDRGPAADRHALDLKPTLVFLSASPERKGGGKSVVFAWVDKFKEAILSNIFRGIVDRDENNIATERVLVLGRYSIENYLLDPLVLFALLREENIAIEVPGLRFSAGNENLIRSFDDNILSAIVAAISSKIEPHLPNLVDAEKENQEVQFTNGRKVLYPKWMLARRGKDLLPIYQNRLASPNIVSPRRLLKQFQRVKMIPLELAELMLATQQA